ncbi:hypothetical protein L2E82_27810 [Cichorium intybus]|uniref:Uncharacterized protein n=1 Tax=Cichorium intybus TaxID=13427 RepID=A0ACB9CTW8_CICIN|nr:hypothetical protein L2E82_27810 [Cichorium intybus]
MEEVRIRTKDLALMAADDRQGSYQVWSSDSDDDEVRKPSHSAFMAYDVDKSFLQDTSEKLNEEKWMQIEATAGLGFVTLEGLEITAADTPKTWDEDSSDDDEEVCLMANDNRLTIPEQRNIFCETAKRLYAHITRIYHSADVCNIQHRQLLPFIEFKLKEVDSISYECESIVSGSEVTNPSYKHGLISVEKHLTADKLLKILPQEIPILNKAVPQIEKDSESDSDMEEINCSSLILLKSSSISESTSEDISQKSSVDKGKTKMNCESKTLETKET